MRSPFVRLPRRRWRKARSLTLSTRLCARVLPSIGMF